MGLEFGERHFDGIEIGAVGRQEQEPCAAFFEDGSGPFAFVAREIVQDDHVTRLERRSELGLNIGFEDTPVHRAVDHPGRGQAIMAQRRDEGLGSPVTEGSLHLEALSLAGATS